MNVGELFSGVGGLALGLERAGMRHAFLCEKNPYRRAVLAERFPGVPIYKDVREVATGGRGGSQPGVVGGNGHGADSGCGRPWSPDSDDRREFAGGGIGLLAGGFPCQDVSSAGTRAGLAGARSGLFFEFARVADTLRPEWILIENVPGLLSSKRGRDFGCVLGTLADVGYGLAWRILDARFFGVPQRRRRVFIVGARADGDPGVAAHRAGEVLAVGTRCSGHPRSSATPGEVASTVLAGGSGGRGWRVGVDEAAGGQLVASTLTSHPRARSTNPGPLAFHMIQDPIHEENCSPALGSKSSGMGVQTQTIVRRLTPRECERLQGAPDEWTLIDYQGPPASDNRRNSAIGDMVVVPVAEWIGRRLMAAEA